MLCVCVWKKIGAGAEFDVGVAAGVLGGLSLSAAAFEMFA